MMCHKGSAVFLEPIQNESLTQLKKLNIEIQVKQTQNVQFNCLFGKVAFLGLLNSFSSIEPHREKEQSVNCSGGALLWPS